MGEQMHRRAYAHATPELTAGRLDSGECAGTDPNFCLLFIVPESARNGKLGPGHTRTLKLATKKFKSDPIRIFVVHDSGLANAFSSAPSGVGAFVLYRPKRKRYKIFEGDPSDSDELVAFVEYAVGSGSQLPLQLASELRHEL